MILFIGPLFEQGVVNGHFWSWIKGEHIRETVGSWIGWRNLVAGPVSEELMFRWSKLSYKPEHLTQEYIDTAVWLEGQPKAQETKRRWKGGVRIIMIEGQPAFARARRQMSRTVTRLKPRSANIRAAVLSSRSRVSRSRPLIASGGTASWRRSSRRPRRSTDTPDPPQSPRTRCS